MKSVLTNGLVIFFLAGALAGCGDKDKSDTADGVPSDAGTTVASDIPSEPPPPPPPPPPPRVVDCTPVQQEAAAPALTRFGRDFQSKAMRVPKFVSSTVKTCQYDTQDARIMATGEYRFKGQMNNDEVGFTVNFNTDATGGDPQFSNLLPDENLERIIRQRGQLRDFLKAVQKPEDVVGVLPAPEAN